MVFIGVLLYRLSGLFVPLLRRFMTQWMLQSSIDKLSKKIASQQADGDPGLWNKLVSELVIRACLKKLTMA